MGLSDKEISVFASKENLIVLVGCWIIIEIIFPFALQTISLDEMLIGTDPFIRLIGVENLINSGDWYEKIISEINAPYGGSLHWTRPLDVFIIIIAAPFMLFFDVSTAVYISGSIISPLFELGLFFAILWCILPLARGDAARVAVIAFFTQAALLGSFHLGRADHHALLALLLVIVIGWVIRLLINPERKSYAYKAGLTAGLGLWVSIEFLFCIAAISVFLAIMWVLRGNQWIRPNKAFINGVAEVALVAFLLEVKPLNYFDLVYDSISIVYVTLFVLIALFWLLVSLFREKIPDRIPMRLCFGLFGAAISLYILRLVGPDFLSGPISGIDPRIISIWLNEVREMQPLIPDSAKGISDFITHMGFGFVIISLAGYFYYKGWYSNKIVWLFIIYMAIFLSVIGIIHVRFLMYPQLCFLILLASIVHILLEKIDQVTAQDKKSSYRLYVFAGMIAIPLTLTYLPMLVKSQFIDEADSQTSDKAKCPVKDMALFLKDRAKGEKYTIETFLDLGPALIYYSRHNVIGAPYHRNGDAIYDSYMMLHTTDVAESFDMAKERGVTHYLLCNKGNGSAYHRDDKNPDATVYARLSRGDKITGLAPVELPDLLKDSFKLYEFNKE